MVGQGRIDDIKRLLKRGFKVNSKMDIGHVKGATALSCAATGGWNEIVKIFLESGADADKAMSDGGTPLFVAFAKGHLEIVKCLVKVGKAEKGQGDE